MTGRPSDFTDEIATRICDLLMDGLSMRSVRWLERYPEFASMYAHARTLQADLMDDMILETANACTPATAHADRVKISAFQWRAAKLKPKVYGDKAEVALTGPNGGPQSQSVTVSVTDPIEAARVYGPFPTVVSLAAIWGQMRSDEDRDR
jgi:hypothetical protein